MTALEEGEYDAAQPSSDVDEGHTSTGEEKKDDPMVTFLGDHGLLDIKQQLMASKLSVRHLVQVERADLEDLCKDLKLSPSQKIRLKHAIKVLRSKRSRKRPKRAKLVIKSKSKRVKNTKNQSKKAMNRPSKPPKKKLEKVLDDDAKHAEVDDDAANVRRIRSKIVIVGEAAVGKTTLQKALKGWEFEEGSKATFSVNSLHYKSRLRCQEMDVQVQYEVYDTPGLDRFRDIIALYLRGALAIVVVFDVCNVASFAKAQQWVEYLESHAAGYDSLILIANKIDIQSTDDGANGDSDDEDADIVTKARMFATEHGIAFLEVSAKEGDNVGVLSRWMDTQSKGKVSRCPALLAKETQPIQLHEPLLGRKRMSRLMDKLDHFDFNYSKCC